MTMLSVVSLLRILVTNGVVIIVDDYWSIGKLRYEPTEIQGTYSADLAFIFAKQVFATR